MRPIFLLFLLLWPISALGQTPSQTEILRRQLLQQLSQTQSNFLPLSGGTMSGQIRSTTGGWYYDDNTGAFVDRNAASTIVRKPTPTASVVSTMWHQCIGFGDNSTFEGCSNFYFQATDPANVASNTKGVLYGGQFSVKPLVGRNNSPADDATGIVIQNDTSNTSIATDAVYIGHNSAFTAGALEWVTSFLTAANSVAAYRAIGTYTNGLDLVGGGPATITGKAVYIPNAAPITSRNALNNADIEIAQVNSSNIVSLAGGKVLIDPSTGSTKATGILKHGVSLVADLPTCNSAAEGSHYGVTDALTPAYHATVGGGGSVHVPVYCDGTNWIVD